MRYLMFFAFLLLSFISQASDTRFEEGVDAYQNNRYQQAFAIFLPLAKAGHVDAQLSVGTMYDRGQGVNQDSQEALKWYQLAADQGDNIAKSLVKTMFNSAEGATNYQDSDHPNASVTPPDNVDSQELISSVLSREEMRNQILDETHLDIMTSTASKPLSDPKKFLFNLEFHKIETWLKNRFFYLYTFIILILICVTLFTALKLSQKAKKTPFLSRPTEDNGNDAFTKNPVLEESFENREPFRISTLNFDYIQDVNESEHNENCLDNDRVKEENLFEYCYNNHTYDEEKLSENPISTILRKRYPSSIMRYCYEECYH